jgi:phenylalanyl-tRNA synthetase beta chain
MKFSYNWLQTYFDEPLSKPEELAEVIRMHQFEVEEVENKGNDFVLDIDVLPNRSSDCLCHRGIAREIATLLKRDLKHDSLQDTPQPQPPSSLVTISVECPDIVNRFSVIVMRGIKVGPSPEWLSRALKSIGQKSINNIVDATNYVMFNICQPLHAFDAEKLVSVDGVSKIAVRTGKTGENITVLTGEKYEVGADDILITDGNCGVPLGIAGVKGGKQAEITEDTKDIILEAANFNFVSVRKTAGRLKLVTDASVRFQNQPSSELTTYALRDVAKLISEIAEGEIEGGQDWYPHPARIDSVSVSVQRARDVLGTDISAEAVRDIFTRLGFTYTEQNETFSVTPPFERTDIVIEEDLIEEIGRVYGYEKIKPTTLSQTVVALEVNRKMLSLEKIRDILVRIDFSEIKTYTFRSIGDVELANALASDKNFLRANLIDGIQEALALNSKNASLLGLSGVKVFEIGHVFKKEGEYTSLCIGAWEPGKKGEANSKEAVRKSFQSIADVLSFSPSSVEGSVAEINLDEYINNFSGDISEDGGETGEIIKDKKFVPISSYPFVLRDVALWVSAGISAGEVGARIRSVAGELLIRADLFDEFEKEGRMSYAFHLVFQSHERTLTDVEVNGIMKKIEDDLCEMGGEVR